MSIVSRVFVPTALMVFSLPLAALLGACGEDTEASPELAAPSAQGTVTPPSAPPNVPEGWVEHTQSLGDQSVVFFAPGDAEISGADGRITVTVVFGSHTSQFFLPRGCRGRG